MKKYILQIFVLMCITTAGFAQVRVQKIGDNPTSLNSSAVLDIESANKGVLMPRVALTSTALSNPLPNHVKGMIVYNTNTYTDPNSTNTAVEEGFYMNNGSTWVLLVTKNNVSSARSGDIDMKGDQIFNASGVKSGNFQLYDDSLNPFFGGSDQDALTIFNRENNVTKVYDARTLNVLFSITNSATGDDISNNSGVEGRVGINTGSPDISADLTLGSSNRGILLNRIALTGTNDNSSVPSTADHLIIFNTATTADVTPGIYYWSTSLNKWVRSGEDTSHKSTDGTFAANSDILFPSQKAVKTYVDQTISNSVPNATGNTLGKIQLGGDLAGQNSSATAPVISNGAISTTKLADAAVSTAKIASGGNNKVLVTDNSGAVQWISSSDFAGVADMSTIEGTGTTANPYKVKDLGIVTGKIANSAITSDKIADGNVVTNKVANAAITSDKIADLNVTTSKLADANVTSSKLSDAAVTTAKIASGGNNKVLVTDNSGAVSWINASDFAGAADLLTIEGTGTSVNPYKVKDLGIITSKLADAAVTTLKLAEAAVTTSKISDAAVTTAKVADAAISTTKVADAAITTAKIASGGTNKVLVTDNTGAVTWINSSDFAGVADMSTIEGAGTTANPYKVKDLGIITSKLADAAVTTAKLADAAITTSKIADANVTTNKLADVNVTTSKLANASVTTAKIAAGANNQVLVTDNSGAVAWIDNASFGAVADLTTIEGAGTTASPFQVKDLGIITAKLADAAVTTAKLADSNVTTSKIADANVTTAKIADGAVNSLKLATDAVTTGKILNGTIINEDIADNTINTSKIAGQIAVSDGGSGSDMSSTIGYVKQATTGANFTTVSTIPVADVTGAVQKVNGVLPDANGAVTINWGTVYTGLLSARSATVTNPSNGDSYVVSGDNSADNGRTFIYDGTSWQEISPNQAALDARYLRLAGGTMQGNIVIPTNNKITLTDAPTTATDASNKAYVDAQILNATPDATTTATGKIKLAGDLGGPGSTATLPVISNSAITTSKLADANVTTSKLADAAVTTAKIASGGNNKVLVTDNSGAVTWINSSDFAGVADLSTIEGTGTTANPYKVKDLGIVTSKIADAAITTNKLADANVTTTKLANAAVTTAKISAGANNQVLVTDNTGAVAWIDNASFGAVADLTTIEGLGTTASPFKVKDLGIITAKLADAAVTTSKIADANVTMAKIAQAGATAGQVLKNNGSAWTPATLQVGEVTGAQSTSNLANTFTGNSGSTLLYPSISAVENYVSTSIAAGAPDATTSATGKVQLAGDLGGVGTSAAAPIISANAITSAKIKDGEVASADLATASVTNAKIGETIVVSNGGTGAISLTGYVKGNGTSSMTASSSIPVSDVTGAQTLTNLSNDIVTDHGSQVKYPSVDLLESYVNSTVSAATPNASTSVVGKIKLAGDLAGTYDAPTVPGLLTKEPIIVAGTTTQYYRGDKTWQTLNKAAVGLSNADNTSDLNKPISTATQSALDLKAPIASPALTGAPTAPTAPAGTSTTQLATTEFVQSTVTTAVNVATPNATTSVVGKIKLAGDLSGTYDLPTVPGLLTKEPTINAGTTTQYYRGDKTWQTLDKSTLGLSNVDNTSDLNKPISTATQAALDLKAPLASPALSGTPTAPTAVAGTNTTQVATTEFVNSSVTSAVNAAATPNASTSVVGKLKLAGDLAGTYDVPTVPGLLTKEPTIITGTTSQYYRGDKTWQTLDKSTVGLSNVDNTSDANKPISSATQAVLDLKAPTASPVLSGIPTAPTATAGTSNNQIATTSFVASAITSASTPDASNIIKGKLKLAGDLGGTADSPTVPGLALKEPTITAGTTSQYYRGDKTWQNLDKVAVGLSNVDNTSDVNKPISTATQSALDLKAPLASPSLTGTPTAPTPVAGTNNTQLATTAFVVNSITNSTTQNATTIASGKVQLAGDLGGTGTTAAAPIISADAITSGKIKDGEVANADLAAGAVTNAKIGEAISIVNGGTGAITAPQALTNLGAEATANKDIDVALGGVSTSDTKFPSQKAVKTYVDNFQLASLNKLPVISNMKVLGNTSGTAAIPQELSVSGTGNVVLNTNPTINGVVLNGSISGTAIVPVTQGGSGANMSNTAGYLKQASTGANFTTVGTIPVADITGAVQKVNGILPDANGAITMNWGTVYTGILSARTATVPNPSNGDTYVVSGDPTVGNNGRTFIYDGTTWQEISTNQAALDARYVQESGDTMTGDLTMASGKKIILNYTPTGGVEAVNKSYVDSVLPIEATSATLGTIKIAGDLSGTGANPVIANNAITTSKIANSSITNAKIAETITVAKGGTGATSLTGYVKGNGTLAMTASSTIPVVDVTGAQTTANLSNDVVADAGSTSKYPSVALLQSYVDGKVSAATPDASSSTKGIVKLTNDLGGTADAPTVPGLLLKAPLASPTFTGVASAPTPTAGDNSTKIATTAFVNNVISSASTPNATTSATGKVQLGGDLAGTGTTAEAPIISSNAITSAKIKDGEVATIDLATGAVTNAKIGETISVSNGGTGATTLTGYVKGNGTSAMTSSTSIPVADVTGAQTTANISGNMTTNTGSTTMYPSVAAVEAYVNSSLSLVSVADATTTSKGKIKLAGDLGGTADLPTVPGLANKAPLASPALTGTPTAPTAAAGTSTTQLATTAFVASAMAVPVSSVVDGIVNRTAGQELGGVDKKIHGVDIGLGAGNINTNTRIGMNALGNNTTGFSNTSIGNASLSSNTTGINNTAIGNNTLFANSTGNDNTAIGAYTLYGVTTAGQNIAIGNSALKSITTSGENVAIGYSALQNATSDRNVAVGKNAGTQITSGKYNTIIGYNTASVLTTGNNNLFLGYQAGNQATTGSNNISLTNDSDFLSTGSRNILIGRSSLTTGNDNVIIGGTNLTLPDPTANNTIVLANGNALTNIKFFANNSGVGILNTNPQQALDVTGSIKQSAVTSSLIKADATGKLIAASNADLKTVLMETEEFTATAAQINFTLSNTPLGKISFFRNGVRVPKTAITISGTTITYVPANNSNENMVVGDRITIDYIY